MPWLLIWCVRFIARRYVGRLRIRLRVTGVPDGQLGMLLRVTRAPDGRLGKRLRVTRAPDGWLGKRLRIIGVPNSRHRSLVNRRQMETVHTFN